MQGITNTFIKDKSCLSQLPAVVAASAGQRPKKERNMKRALVILAAILMAIPASAQGFNNTPQCRTAQLHEFIEYNPEDNVVIDLMAH